MCRASVQFNFHMTIKEVIQLISVSLIKSLLVLTIDIEHGFTLLFCKIRIKKLSMVENIVTWAIYAEIVAHEHYFKLI